MNGDGEDDRVRNSRRQRRRVPGEELARLGGTEERRCTPHHSAVGDAGGQRIGDRHVPAGGGTGVGEEHGVGQSRTRDDRGRPIRFRDRQIGGRGHDRHGRLAHLHPVGAAEDGCVGDESAGRKVAIQYRGVANHPGTAPGGYRPQLPDQIRLPAIVGSGPPDASRDVSRAGGDGINDLHPQSVCAAPVAIGDGVGDRAAGLGVGRGDVLFHPQIHRRHLDLVGRNPLR